jgi:hypothetical protein
VTEVQVETRKRIGAEAFANGYRFKTVTYPNPRIMFTDLPEEPPSYEEPNKFHKRGG